MKIHINHMWHIYRCNRNSPHTTALALYKFITIRTELQSLTQQTKEFSCNKVTRSRGVALGDWYLTVITSIACAACPKNNLSCQSPSLSMAICRSERDGSCLIRHPPPPLHFKTNKNVFQKVPLTISGFAELRKSRSFKSRKPINVALHYGS